MVWVGRWIRGLPTTEEPAAQVTLSSLLSCLGETVQACEASKTVSALALFAAPFGPWSSTCVCLTPVTILRSTNY